MIDKIFSRMALDVVDASMRLLEKRQEYIASNIANVDTPGYKAKRFSFEKQLQSVVYGGGELPLMVTHPAHIEVPAGSVDEVKGVVTERMYPVRNDGNSVDIDEEMALLAQTQLKYNALAQSLSQQLARLKYAITGR